MKFWVFGYLLLAVVASVTCANEPPADEPQLIVPELINALREAGATEETIERVAENAEEIIIELEQSEESDELVARTRLGGMTEEAVQLLVPHLPKLSADDRLRLGLTDEIVQRITDVMSDNVVHVVRTDTYRVCSEVIANKLRKKLKKVRVYARNARRLRKFEKIISEIRSDLLDPPPLVATFSTEPLPFPSSEDACQLITEVQAPRWGFDIGDGKPIVDVWDNCWVQQSLHTMQGAYYFDEEPEKKVHCKVLLSLAELDFMRNKEKQFELLKRNLEVLETLPCRVIKSKLFRYENPTAARISGGLVFGTIMGAVGIGVLIGIHSFGIIPVTLAAGVLLGAGLCAASKYGADVAEKIVKLVHQTT